MIAMLQIALRQLADRFGSDEEGAALVEYGMLIGLIAVVCSVAVALVGTNLSGGLAGLATNIGTWFIA